MKKLIFLLGITLVTLSTYGQLVSGNKPYASINEEQGYITINEFAMGYGLGSQAIPFSKSFYGFTTLHGFQVNQYFMTGAGTGLLFYDSGLMVPLYLDMRIRIPINQFTPYASGSGGLLINTKDFNSGTRMFINPAIGIRYSINRKLAATFSGGLWIQMGANVSRSSFVNTKLGVVYVF